MVGADQRIVSIRWRLRPGVVRAVVVALLAVPGFTLGDTGAVAAVRAPAELPSTSARTFKTVLVDGFGGRKLNLKTWRYRRTGSIVANRYCAVPAKNNNATSGGKLASTVRPATAVEAAKITAKAIAAQRADGLAGEGCPNGAYTYAMIGADRKSSATVYYGRLTARVRNPTGQGPYGAVWLRSVGDSTKSLVSEIDMFESWGFGRGITNYVHYRDSAGILRDYPVEANQYVVSRFTDQPGFWDKYHTFSVEWVPNDAGQTVFTFMVDTTTTAQYVLTTPKVKHYVVISNIIAQWSIPWLTHPAQRLEGVTATTLPQSMLVDWVRLEKLVK